MHVQQVPDQSGRVAVVTGANSGLGLETTRALAARGALVVMACRDAGRAARAAEDVRRSVPEAKLEVRSLDLASLASVRRFADEVRAAWPRVDVLVNNAGVMATQRALTADGFELQFGTNHLGPFALTAALWPSLEAAPAARVVAVSSLMHGRGRIAFDDLHGERRYTPWGGYAQAKLANLLFTRELERRLRARGARAIAVAAHPGYSATNLAMAGQQGRVMGWLMKVGDVVLAQSAAAGAAPTVHAACASGVQGGDFVGPSGLFELRGRPTKVGTRPQARDDEAAARLWDVSVQLTGARWW